MGRLLWKRSGFAFQREARRLGTYDLLFLEALHYFSVHNISEQSVRETTAMPASPPSFLSLDSTDLGGSVETALLTLATYTNSPGD